MELQQMHLDEIHEMNIDDIETERENYHDEKNLQNGNISKTQPEINTKSIQTKDHFKASVTKDSLTIENPARSRWMYLLPQHLKELPLHHLFIPGE